MTDTRVIIFIAKYNISNFLSVVNTLGDNATMLMGLTNDGKKWIRENKFQFYESYKMANGDLHDDEILQLSVSIQVYTALNIINQDNF